MKRISFIVAVVLCLIFIDQAHAQRQLPGMRGLEIRGGMVDGFYSSAIDNDAGYFLGAALSTYAKNGNKWLFGAEFLERYNPYREIRLPVSQFTGEAGYYFNFLSTPSKVVSFSLGTSALGGYEAVNWGKSVLYDGSTLLHKDSFIYGGAITLEMETYLSDRVVFLLSARERILWGTTTGHFHTQFGVGLKFMIN